LGVWHPTTGWCLTVLSQCPDPTSLSWVCFWRFADFPSAVTHRCHLSQSLQVWYRDLGSKFHRIRPTVSTPLGKTVLSPRSCLCTYKNQPSSHVCVGPLWALDGLLFSCDCGFVTATLPWLQ
jgi:hypothetical protein